MELHTSIICGFASDDDGVINGGAGDAALLALAFAFILVLGLAPVRHLAFQRNSYLRPPLRGPPAAA